MRCPGINSADEVRDVAVALLDQEIGRLLRAPAVVAGDNYFGCLFQFAMARGKLVEGNVECILELADVELVLVAHVDEGKFLSRVDFLLEIVD
jgi:hypothetical protein